MIDNDSMPIGFMMEMARQPEALNCFSSKSEAEQNTIVNGARNVHSRDEMRQYVARMAERPVMKYEGPKFF